MNFIFSNACSRWAISGCGKGDEANDDEGAGRTVKQRYTFL